MLFFVYILATLIASASALVSSTRSACAKEPGTKYPNKCEITEVFNNLNHGNFPGFFTRVAPNVNWTLMGTHPLAGQYHNRTIFIADALERLGHTMSSPQSTSLRLLDVIGGGDSEWSVQELHGLGVCKNGLKYDNRFAWVTRWNTDGIIVEVRSYLDSALVHRAIVENEVGEYTYTDQRNTLQPGPTGINCAA